MKISAIVPMYWRNRFSDAPVLALQLDLDGTDLWLGATIPEPACDALFGMGAHPGVHYLNWDVVHLVHHRAQLGLYLRLAGEKVPSIYGPTLDVSFEDMVGS